MVLLFRVANTGILGSVLRDCVSIQEEEEDTDIKRNEYWRNEFRPGIDPGSPGWKARLITIRPRWLDVG